MRLLIAALAGLMVLAGCGQTLWTEYKPVKILAVRGPDTVRVGEFFTLVLTISRSGEESSSYCNLAQDVTAQYIWPNYQYMLTVKDRWHTTFGNCIRHMIHPQPNDEASVSLKAYYFGELRITDENYNEFKIIKVID